MSKLISTLSSKKNFLALVFINLILQLGITYYVMEKTNNININIWLLFISQIVILIVMAYPIPKYIKFALFCLFSYIFGLVLSLLKKKYSPEMIKVAMQGALSIFALMMAFGATLFASGINLGYKVGAGLFFALLGFLVAKIVSILTSKGEKIIAFLGIMLFSVYVLYNTNQILQRNYFGDFIQASMDYYLDLILIFKNILRFNDE